MCELRKFTLLFLWPSVRFFFFKIAIQLHIDALPSAINSHFVIVLYWRQCPGRGTVLSTDVDHHYITFHSPAWFIRCSRKKQMSVQDHCVLFFKKPEGGKKMQEWEFDLGENFKAAYAH